jgi:hypothetical protein
MRIFTVKRPGHGVAEGTDEFVDLARVAQEAAADVLLVDLGRRATHVQVDAGDGIFQQLLHGADHVADFLTDELGEDRAAGLVLYDGADDVFLRARLGVDAEEFGEEVVRRTVVRGMTRMKGRSVTSCIGASAVSGRPGRMPGGR